MSRVKVIVAVAFAMALCAGVAVGMLSAKLPQSHEPRSWMADELGLTPEQRDQMRSIWQEASKGRQRDWERRRAIEKERNEAIVALLSPEQKSRYDEIHQKSQQELAELSRQREETFQQATERTKQMLTPEQRVKYESMLQKRRDSRENSGSRRGGGGGPATEPSAHMPIHQDR